jgi:transcriptional regulator with XRE-family HTH domain
MKVHEKIRFLRESKKLSQEEVAARLNMSVSGYSKIERGESNANFDKLEQIAEALEIKDIMELMALGERYILINENSHNHHSYNNLTSSELAFENQKLHLLASHKDEMIEHLKQEIISLKEMLVICKSPNS